MQDTGADEWGRGGRTRGRCQGRHLMWRVGRRRSVDVERTGAASMVGRWQCSRQTLQASPAGTALAQAWSTCASPDDS